MEKPDSIVRVIASGEPLYVFGNTSVTEGWLDENGNEHFIHYELDRDGNVVPPAEPTIPQ